MTIFVTWKFRFSLVSINNFPTYLKKQSARLAHVERRSGVYEFCESTRPRVAILFACALESVGWRSGEATGIGACVAGATICGVGTILCFLDVELVGEKTCKSKFMSVTSIEKRELCRLLIFHKISSAFRKINSSLVEPGSINFSGCQDNESDTRMPFVEGTYTRKLL